MSYYHLCCKGNHDRAPEKIRNIMLDEPSICEEILPLANVYYHFSWLDSARKHFVYIPDGEIKCIVFPLIDRSLLLEVIETFNQEYSLISGGKPITYAYYPDAEIQCIKGEYIVSSIGIPFVRLNCFLKHLVSVIKMLKEHKFDLPGFKELEHLFGMKILDPMETKGRIYYPANPHQGYECYAIELGEEKEHQTTQI